MEKQGVVYRIGRTMFETDRLPDHLVSHVKAFDEVWVPSEFNKETFAASGVDATRIFVLPESVDTSIEWNPALHTPLTIKEIGALIATGKSPTEQKGSKTKDPSDF